MNNPDYYAELLKDLKKEYRRESGVIRSLKDMHAHLKAQGYAPLDPLEGVIKDLRERQKYIDGYIKRIEKTVK